MGLASAEVVIVTVGIVDVDGDDGNEDVVGGVTGVIGVVGVVGAEEEGREMKEEEVEGAKTGVVGEGIAGVKVGVFSNVNNAEREDVKGLAAGDEGIER